MTWDAIVIGAGPAGSVTARELARRGLHVLLVDKATFPRAKVCGCCLNGAALSALEQLGLQHVVRDAGAIPLERVKLAAGSRSAELRLPGGVSLSREVLDAALVREAQAAGVEFAAGLRAKIENVGDPCQRVVTLSNGRQYAARIVIQATGIAGSNTKVEPHSRIGAGCLVHDAPDFFARGTIFMATGRGGYVGVVRLEDGRLDLGAAFDSRFVHECGGLGPAAASILQSTGWPTVDGLAAMAWKGTPALTRRPTKVADHRLFAVGDAAGYVEPFTGEGMAWAVSSAAALAPIVARAAAVWDVSCIGEWQRTHARLVGRRQGICRIAARTLRSPFWTGIAVRMLAAAPALARPVTTLLNHPSRIARYAT